MSKALIICDTPKAIDFFSEMLSQNDYDRIDVVEIPGEAKRRLVEQDYDICLINSPIKGESGEQLSIDIAEKNICQVLLFVKVEYMDEITEKVEDFGVITVAKPVNRQMFWSALKLARVAQRRLSMARKENEKLKGKLEDLKLVSKAKIMLVSFENMTEEQAHKWIEKYAMNERMSRVEVAQMIINRYS